MQEPTATLRVLFTTTSYLVGCVEESCFVRKEAIPATVTIIIINDIVDLISRESREDSNVPYIL